MATTTDSTKCACVNRPPSCGCDAKGRKPGGCCCGETCTCGDTCQCPPSCGCPSAKTK
jgi:hypothetical protein